MKSSQTSKLAALSGTAFFVLATVGHFITPDAPAFMAKPAAAQAFFQQHEAALLPADTIHLFSAMALVIFAAVLRTTLRRAHGGDSTLSTAVFGALLAAAALLFASASIEMAGALHVQEQGAIDAQSASVLWDLNNVLYGLAAPMALVVAVLGCALGSLRHHALPAWLGALSIPLGVALAIPPINHVSFVVFTFWALVTSLVLAVRETPDVSLLSGNRALTS